MPGHDDTSSLDDVSDNELNMALIDDEKSFKKKNELTIINTNARSLTPKIDSLLDCFSELEVDIAIVTETWLRDGPALTQDLRDLELGADVLTLTKNRDPHPTTGVCHGGVAIIYKKRIGRFKEIEIDNPEKYEVLVSVGTLIGTSRKLVVVGAYLPPNYSTARGSGCIDFVESLLVDLKQRYRDPFIVVAGDFNQWGIDQAFVEFPDIRETAVGPTRGDRSIDRFFSNMSRSVTAAGTVPPLESDSSASDHLISLRDDRPSPARNF